VLIAAPLRFPRLGVTAIAAPPGRGPVKVHFVTLVIGIAKAIVAYDASCVGLAGATVPRNVTALKDVTAGAGLELRGGNIVHGRIRRLVQQALEQCWRCSIGQDLGCCRLFGVENVVFRCWNGFHDW
jgi:hypothetical protein